MSLPIRRNIFCRITDLDSEADVEALVVEKLLATLGYPDDRISRKDSLDKIKVSRGRSTEQYRPDYVLRDRQRRPATIIDAKAPTLDPANYHYQVGRYAYELNQRYRETNPVRYVAVTNGVELILWEWDSNEPVLQMSFEDFEEDNQRFLQLRSMLAYGALEVTRATTGVFMFERPELNDLLREFNECHNIIWKKEAHGPTDAFYEFAKLMFVKLREDNRIVSKIQAEEILAPEDFNFSVAWINEQAERGISDNPMNEILFKRVRDDLEEQIRRGDKKRIFDSDEELQLRAETVLQVVERLEHYDLHSIDEDLNGRMFETFLNATVRGKDLGQFFTPRSVVKHMCHAAEFMIKKGDLPLILDGCCGSGGFLIEAMTVLVHAINARNDLSNREKDQLKRRLYKNHLYGIEKAGKIARIARLNMYLHGDGGGKIFTTDTLDKALEPPTGLTQEIRDEVIELRQDFIDNDLKFDVVLTNPPFSMSYKSETPDERRILAQYKIASSRNEKSNVLFLERYYDLLRDGGELLTVIDNTVLNGTGSQQYRDFICDKFIIRQIIALPFNTFYRADAGVQTSILHLKKREAGEEQGPVFMAILNNIGHDDHQRYTPERDNIPRLKQAYLNWRETGEITKIFEPNVDQYEGLGCPFQVFMVPHDQLNPRRLDAFYYAPDLHNTISAITRRADEGILDLAEGGCFRIVPTMKGREVSECRGEVFRYFDIGDVTPEGAIFKYREDLFENLPSRARLRVRANDVVFAKNISSRGTAVIVPQAFDGQLVTTGFMAIRPKDEEEALLLWSVFTSEFFRKQIYYSAITAVQPEIREDIFRKFILPIPKRKDDREILISHARKVYEFQQSTWGALEAMKDVTRGLFDD